MVEGVLKEVKRQCAAGSAIVSADDIRDGLDEGLRADDKEIAAALERLKARRIIEINFARGNVYCFTRSEQKQESARLAERAP